MFSDVDFMPNSITDRILPEENENNGCQVTSPRMPTDLYAVEHRSLFADRKTKNI